MRAHREARLLVLGEGRERPALEALVASLGLGADVELPGYVDDPFAWLARRRGSFSRSHPRALRR